MKLEDETLVLIFFICSEKNFTVTPGIWETAGCHQGKIKADPKVTSGEWISVTVDFWHKTSGKEWPKSASQQQTSPS